MNNALSRNTSITHPVLTWTDFVSCAEMLGIFTSVFLVQKGSKVFQRGGRKIFSYKYKDHRLCDLLEAGSFERKGSQTPSTSGNSAVGL